MNLEFLFLSIIFILVIKSNYIKEAVNIKIILENINLIYIL